MILPPLQNLAPALWGPGSDRPWACWQCGALLGRVAADNGELRLALERVRMVCLNTRGLLMVQCAGPHCHAWSQWWQGAPHVPPEPVA